MNRLSKTVAALALASVLSMLPTSAAALPVYDGAMSFPAIAGPLDPEDYSWEVSLDDGQALRSVDELHAEVYYVDGGHVAFEIKVTSAHDANGVNVPTSLSITDPNVITLTVHHSAGNPLAEGVPFTYPVVPGAGWLVIGGGTVVTMPLPEGSVEEMYRRIVAASPPAQAGRRPSARRCLVPKLVGRSLSASRQRLRGSNCRLGHVGRRADVTAKTGTVVRQNPKPGTLLAGGAGVNVTLGD